jgi:hypothetical protein
MRHPLSLSLALAAGLALLASGCSNSKPGPASVPANPVPIPKDGPSEDGGGKQSTGARNTKKVMD